MSKFIKARPKMKGFKQLYTCTGCNLAVFNIKTHTCVFIGKCVYCRKTILGLDKQPNDFCNQDCKDLAVKEHHLEEAMVGNL